MYVCLAEKMSLLLYWVTNKLHNHIIAYEFPIVVIPVLTKGENHTLYSVKEHLERVDDVLK